jgi:hypothetical protein
VKNGIASQRGVFIGGGSSFFLELGAFRLFLDQPDTAEMVGSLYFV